ncbi:hypothetical protein SRHO_G00134640 [Serrasalmus rhombeus]
MSIEQSGPSPTTSSRPQFSFMRSAPSATSRPTAYMGTPRTPIARSFQRSVHLADLKEGKLIPTRVIVLRFTEVEANVPTMLDKVREALDSEESFVLTEAQDSEVLDTEGTRGSVYWKQNSRKNLAVMESTQSTEPEQEEETKVKYTSVTIH